MKHFLYLVFHLLETVTCAIDCRLWTLESRWKTEAHKKFLSPGHPSGGDHTRVEPRSMWVWSVVFQCAVTLCLSPCVRSSCELKLSRGIVVNKGFPTNQPWLLFWGTQVTLPWWAVVFKLILCQNVPDLSSLGVLSAFLLKPCSWAVNSSGWLFSLPWTKINGMWPFWGMTWH
jgi:hypothetical protein